FCLRDPASTALSTLSLHDALPISRSWTSPRRRSRLRPGPGRDASATRPARADAAIAARRPGAYRAPARVLVAGRLHRRTARAPRSEEHTSELQSRENLVCRLLLEK